MTVAAVVLVPDLERALADALGEAAIRRIVHTAWAGGAVPVVVVARGAPAGPTAGGTGDAGAEGSAAGSARGEPDPLVDALAGLPATVSHPPDDVPPGAAWFAHGQLAARQAVAETSAALLWPVRYAWIDPETVTSLVEAHGIDPAALVRPAYRGQPGFPIAVPTELRERLAARPELHAWQVIERLIDEGVPYRAIELGDPGIVHDLATAHDALPLFEGPPQPVGGPSPDWNEAVAAGLERERPASAEATRAAPDRPAQSRAADREAGSA